MMGNPLLHFETQALIPGVMEFPLKSVLYLLSQSVVLGILLSLTAYLTSLLALEPNLRKDPILKTSVLQEASGILFLCVGLSAVMVLVNNNLARAFAIGAALALIRFRVNLAKKGSDANLLFGVVAGIACGINAVTVAWISSLFYILLQSFISICSHRINPTGNSIVNRPNLEMISPLNAGLTQHTPPRDQTNLSKARL